MAENPLVESIKKLMSDEKVTNQPEFYEKMTMTLDDLVPHLDEIGLLKLKRRLDILAGNESN